MKHILLILILSFHVNSSYASDWLDIKPGTIFGKEIASEIIDATGETPYMAFEVDFDNDSKPEHVIGILCGNAGCENLIFKKLNNGTFKYITSAGFHRKAFQLIPNAKSKLSDIYLYRRSNVGMGCLVLLKYENSEYIKTSKECGSSELFEKIELEEIEDAKL